MDSGLGNGASVGEAVASVRRRWVEALRSGEYAQGRGALKSADDAFCCLGVLCDLVQPDAWERDELGYWTHSGMECYPPDHVTTVAGVNTFSGKLAEDNDTGVPFAKIADYIESLPLPESAS